MNLLAHRILRSRDGFGFRKSWVKTHSLSVSISAIFLDTVIHESRVEEESNAQVKPEKPALLLPVAARTSK